MGIYCAKDSQGKVICHKCKDRFLPWYGMKSQRNSCRHHTFVKDETGEKYCIDCKQFKKRLGSKNCYHSYHSYY